MDLKLVGSFLKKRRVSLKLTQRRMAELLGFQGSQFISNIERGVADIPPSRIKDFANVLEIDIEKLASMVSETMKTRMLNKTALSPVKNDPFIDAFLLAWQTASEESKNCIKYLTTKILDMDG